MKSRIIEILNTEEIEQAERLELKAIPEPEFIAGDFLYFKIKEVSAFCFSDGGHINLFIQGEKITVEYSKILERRLKNRFK